MGDASTRPHGAYLPLPEALPDDSRRGRSGKPLLADGCYFLAFGHADLATSLGTLRVDSRAGPLLVSGDLYQIEPDLDGPVIGQIPPRGPGIPIFPISAYRHYLRITKIELAGDGILLTFEAHLFLPIAHPALTGLRSPHFRFEDTYTVHLMPANAPAGYLSPEMFFVGEVRGAEFALGRMQVGWVSPTLRKAVVEIDRVAGCEAPESNGAGVTWNSIFDPIGWDVTAVVSDSDVKKKDELPWSSAEARKVLATHRDNHALDAEWRYHILVVPHMTRGNSDFGIMYHDAREGLMMSSHFVFPADDARWGPLRGLRFGSTVAFFRNALHEMGHAMGLEHNHDGFCFMRVTNQIAGQAPADKPFPSNIVWSFDPADERRLRHWPDIAVRPGGIDTGGGGIDVPT